MAVHAVVVGLLAFVPSSSRRRDDGAGRQAADEAVSVEIAETPPPLLEGDTTVAPVAGTAPVAVAVPVVAPPRASADRPPRRPQGVSTPAAPAPAEPTPAPAESTPTGSTVAGPTVAGPTVADLALESLSPEARRRLAGPAPDATIVLQPPARPYQARPSVDELRIARERQEDAVANVDRGRADPILYDWLRGARARFESDARHLAESLPLGPGATLESWRRGYANHLREIASRIGGPGAGLDVGPRTDALDAFRRTQGEPPLADLFAAYNEATREASDGAEERTTELCVDIGRDVARGGTPTATILRASGLPLLDRLVVASFTRAIAARPVPPDLRPAIACYEVRLSAFRIPPLPVFSCALDPGFSTGGCVWPFKRVTSVTGHLVSVDYSAGEAASQKPSLLRRPR